MPQLTGVDLSSILSLVSTAVGIFGAILFVLAIFLVIEGFGALSKNGKKASAAK